MSDYSGFSINFNRVSIWLFAMLKQPISKLNKLGRLKMAKGANKPKEGKGKQKLTTKEKQDKKKEKAKGK